MILTIIVSDISPSDKALALAVRGWSRSVPGDITVGTVGTVDVEFPVKRG